MMLTVASLITLLVTPIVHGFPLEPRQAVTKLSAAQISAFSPWAFFASAAYCAPDRTLAWNCGFNCDSSPGFKPVASGGDGEKVQFWYVGFDPRAATVVVSHQGTDSSKLLPILTDANFFLDNLDSRLFPGVPSGAKVHNGVGNSQEKSADAVLAAVRKTIAQFNATSVTVVGHSLGGAISLIDAVFLSVNLPTTIPVSLFTFGMPRVGNQAFIDFVDSRLAGRVARVTNREDLVPIVPGRFLGFRHPKGERHILNDGSWANCPGNDNKDKLCIVGEVKNIFDGGPGHAGPYDGTGVTRMGCQR